MRWLLLIALAALAIPVASAVDLPAEFNIGGQLDDTGTTAAIEDDFAFWRLTPQRAGHVNLRSQAGVEIDPRTRTWNLSAADVPLVSQGTAAAAAGAWPAKITDGTNTAAVKAASTAPLATDPALVVVPSPNGNQATAANQATQITSLQLLDDAIGSATGGTAAVSSALVGGKYNVTLPVLTDGQQAAIQVDQNGRVITSAITGFGAAFRFGDVALASAANTVAVNRTTYTEQTSNAQRSIASASASDAAAGTGARTVKITYLTSTGTGPFTEIITLNGTSYVNTVASNICFIERIEVVTVGSGGANVGILTLKAAAAGGGATVGTIAANDNQTFWSLHYVPVGKVTNITGISFSNDSTAVGNGALFTIKSMPIGVANAVDIQVSDFITLFGQSSAAYRAYNSPIQITGPARIIVYVKPNNNTAQTQRAAIDFFEP